MRNRTRPTLAFLRAPAVVLAAGLTLPGWAGGASAQPFLTGSDLAAVTFPQVSEAWQPAPDGSQAAALDSAAALAGRACGVREYHLWTLTTATPDELRSQIDTAFRDAGWQLEVVSLAEDGQRIYLARRDGLDLVMTWMPTAGGIGLLLCAATVAEAVPEALSAPGAQAPGMIVPRPRPPFATGMPGNAPGPEPAPPMVLGTPEQPRIVGSALMPEGIRVGAEATESGAATAEAAAAAGRGQSLWTRLALFIVAGLFAFAAWRLLGSAFAGFRNRRNAGWPTTFATVLAGQVATKTDKDRRGRERTRFLPVVLYEYSVGGRTYRSARMRFGSIAETTSDAAHDVLERFPPGAGIEIHYDPKQPEEASIEPPRQTLQFGLIAGVAAAVLALACVIGGLS